MDKNKRAFDKHRLAVSAVSVQLILVLVIAATVAWFAIGDTPTKPLPFGIGKVAYEVQQVSDLFYSSYELEEEYYDDEPDIEEGNYIAATAVTAVLSSGTPVVPDGNNFYGIELKKNTTKRLTLTLAPLNATDKIAYSTSNAQAVTVSTYGTVRAVGEVGDSAVITITSTDRDTAPGRRVEVFTRSVTVNVTANADDDNNLYGFLPGNINILKSPLTVVNKSTVDSKMRVKIEWTYSDYTEDDTLANERKAVPVSTVLQSGTHTDNVSYVSAVKAPLQLTLCPGMQCVPADADAMSLNDLNNRAWTVETLSLTSAEEASLRAALADSTHTAEFRLTEKMIDKAVMYVTVSASAITDSSADYADLILKNTAEDGTPIQVLTGITTNSDYAAFSSRKVFTVTVTVQARQGKAYDETEWYDVYCLKNTHSHS